MPRPMQRKDDPVFASSIHFFNPGQPVYGRPTRDYIREGYRKAGVVYACVNKISLAAAGIKWKLWTDHTMQREITDHPLLDLWNTPNPKMGTAELVENLFGYLHLTGNMYLWANRLSPNEPPGELWPLRSDWMKIIPGQVGISSYKFGPSLAQSTPFDPSVIMHVKFPSYDDDLYGLSPIEVAATMIEQTIAGNEWNTALMQNFGKPSSAFFSKHLLSEEQRGQITDEILEKYSGKRNAGLPLILEADMTWQQMSLAPAQLDWLESRNMNKRDIALIFDVAPELVADTASKTFANAEQAEQHLYTDNVLPKLDKVDGHLNVWLVPMFPDLLDMGAYFTYDRKDIEALASLYATTKQQQAARSNENYKSTKITINEARVEDGYPELPGGDRLIMGSSLIPIALLKEPVIISYTATGIVTTSIEDALNPPAPPAPVVHILPANATPPGLPAPGDTSNKPPDGNEPPGDTNAPPVTPKPSPDQSPPPATPEAVRAMLIAFLQKAGIKIVTEPETPIVEADLDTKQVHSPQETAFYNAIVGVWTNEKRAVIRAAHSAATLATAESAVDTAITDQKQALTDAFVQQYKQIGDTAAARIAQQFAKYLDPDMERKVAASLPQISDFILARITGIDETTRSRVGALFEQAYTNNWSPYELAPKLQSLYDGFTTERAWSIARTETMSASNYGGYTAATATGLPLTKTWLATDDKKTRPTHRAADGQTVNLTDSFLVGNSLMSFPGDSSQGAGPDEIDNCRCSSTYSMVDDLEGMSRSPAAPRRLTDEQYRASLKGWHHD